MCEFEDLFVQPKNDTHFNIHVISERNSISTYLFLYLAFVMQIDSGDPIKYNSICLYEMRNR